MLFVAAVSGKTLSLRQGLFCVKPEASYLEGIVSITMSNLN